MSPQITVPPTCSVLNRGDSADSFRDASQIASLPARGPLFFSELALNPELIDQSIALRPFRSEDLTALHAATLETTDMLFAWMTWCRPGYSLEDCQSFLAQAAADWAADCNYSFAIFDLKDGRLCGSISLNHVDRAHRCANVGYWIRSSRTRRGIASRALRLVSRFGLRQLHLNRLEIIVPEGNLASQRVAQKAGARFEGLLRHKLMLNAQAHDAVMYSLVATDLV
jgi:RimJ/RimL family protein N-acetyltransferase